MNFIDYKKTVFTLVNDLETLRQYAQYLKLNESLNLISEVLNRIQEDSFKVAVVGEFKRGKSTFINALLGKEILPADVMPTTATLNRVKYHINPAVEIEFKDGTKQQIPIDQLPEYVTKLTEDAEKRAASIKEAVVYYPVPYCQNNVEIIDTPGLNDDVKMTETTLSVLPQVDAAIFVIMALAPFSQYEQDFLENKLLTSDLGRVIFVITGIDRFNRPQEAQKVITGIETRIKNNVIKRAKEQFGEGSPEYETYMKKIGRPKIFALSGYQYLEGKLANDPQLIAESKFEEFSTALEHFLTEDRGAILLQVPVNRLISSANDIIRQINLQEQALQMKQSEFEAAYQASLQEISNIRQTQQKELSLIDQAANNIKYRVRPLLYQMPEEIKNAVVKVIDETEIKPKELDNKQQIQDKMGAKVAATVQQASNKISAKIQREIQEGIDREVERLKDFAKLVDQALQRIDMKFQVQVNENRPRNATGEAITAALAVFTGFGGIWSGYRAAGVKGALAGAGASVATAFAAGIVAAIVGAPITLPFILIAGVASIFTGDWVAKLAFGQDRVKSFKTNYTEQVLKEIDKQLSENLEKNVNSQINDLFSQLKDTLQNEVNTLLVNTEKTLVELQQKRGQNITLNETEKRQLEEVRQNSDRILGNAQRLSTQLAEIMSV